MAAHAAESSRGCRPEPLPVRRNERMANRVVGSQPGHRLAIPGGRQITGHQPRHQTRLDTSNRPDAPTHPPPAEHACRHQQYDDSSPGQHHVDHLRRTASPTASTLADPAGKRARQAPCRWPATRTPQPGTQMPESRVPPAATTNSVSITPIRCGLHRGGRHDHQPAAATHDRQRSPRTGQRRTRDVAIPDLRFCPSGGPRTSVSEPPWRSEARLTRPLEFPMVGREPRLRRFESRRGYRFGHFALAQESAGHRWWPPPRMPPR
jgi:hypothetical protein